METGSGSGACEAAAAGADGVTVVVIHHGQPDRCIGTAAAFSGQTVPVRLIVVDNGSPARDRERLRRCLPDATIVELGANRGFGPAANAGIRRWLDTGRGEWVVVAPHDSRPAPDALAVLMDVAGRRPRAGIACAEYGDRTRAVVDPFLGGLVVPLDAEGPWIATEHPHGTLLALRRQCLAEVGLFDERYFAYVEEADLGLRASAAGWEVGMVLGSVVRNPGTTVRRPVVEYLQTRNTLLLVRDHFGAYNASMRLLIGVVSTANQWLRPSVRAPWFDARARWMAMADYLRRRFGPPPLALIGTG